MRWRTIPQQREFATKGDLAKAMVVRALASPLPIAWVTADSAYGQERRFRRMLEEVGVGYVLAVPKSQHVTAWAASTSPSPRHPTRCRNATPAATAQRAHASTTGQPPACPPSTTSTATRPPTTGGSWPDAVWPAPTRSPTTSPTHPPAPPRPRWSASPAHAGRSRKPSRPPRTNVAWTSTKSAATRAGLVPAHHPGHIRPRLPRRDGRTSQPERGCRNGSGTLTPLTVAEIRRLLAACPRYLLRGPARGPLASGPGMTVSPCRTHDLGGGVTGPGRCRRRR
ncbi:transposase [Streptomyces odonnellii]|uniref:transposase n=1 Tax=Streptomyces odonnellii TaxID=1417980 RepID=UPI0038CD116F